MQIKDVSFEVDHGYPFIQFTLDGFPARLYPDQKRTLLDMGYLALAPALDWETRLSPIQLDADDDNNRPPTTLRGVIYSPELAGLYRRFMRAISSESFQPGPVKFP